MEKSGRSAWCRGVCRSAAIVALGVLLGIAPGAARAVCSGDCNGDNEVTVNELITMVNIALGTANVSTCTAGDVNGDGEITINEIIAGVKSALEGCIVPQVCGNGRTEGDEECDDGGTCIGGTNAGVACKQETDCQGEGICDAYGIPGGGARKACSSDADCAGAKCIHCKSFGGDGCAANCTTESEVVTHLVPGELEGADVKAGTSGAVVHGDILTIPLTLTGTNTFTVGKERNGKIPVIQKTTGVELPQIKVGEIACACVRGVVFKTCGGTELEADGVAKSTDCTNDESACTGKKPCTAVAGPGNAGEGVIGCEGLPGVNFSNSQDGGGSSGTPGPVIFRIEPGTGGPGSQLFSTASAIGTVVGACTGTKPDYGPDGKFCTDDDPASNRGTPSIQTLTTGTASGALTNANGIDGNDLGPFTITGRPTTCADLASGNLSGGALAGAFTSLAQPTTGDIVVTNIFVAQ